ncbi:DNA cytosine methyltransferase [Mesorhizobium sp. M0239]|uniref:DNA cytosine methyltransferase n=1 Tax=Mesorhizobium sp. M0239 TaxID=2956924 RepID=UPI003338BCB7
MSDPIAIVDLFSGPGGLGEGFSACRGLDGKRRYRISLSIEKEESAHRTLRMRAFLHQFETFPPEYYAWLNGKVEEPDWKKVFPKEWAIAEDQARCMELGNNGCTRFLQDRLAAIREQHGGRTLLIGGPPCQAYSLVGRARNSGIAGYDPELDHRNFLYDEYVKVLEYLEPAAFVMENVKGMLSATIQGNAIFGQVMKDLRNAGGKDNYQLFALGTEFLRSTEETRPQDFVVRAEQYGVPQARHRVIVVGLRQDVVDGLPKQLHPHLERKPAAVSVSMALSGMPRMRSGLSKSDSDDAWEAAMKEATKMVKQAVADLSSVKRAALRTELARLESEYQSIISRGGDVEGGLVLPAACPPDLQTWLLDSRLNRLPQNKTRGHMPSDLGRYLFAACYGRAFGVSPNASDFPQALAPNHRNWSTGKFSDRFRVQLAGRPSTTVTSHISKDGHYFIHPDPAQCRSLTVREAARLQTFPDNYVFLGTRTQQYVQVGNAVPPFLARQIADALLPVFAFADTKRFLSRDQTYDRGWPSLRQRPNKHRISIA